MFTRDYSVGAVSLSLCDSRKPRKMDRVSSSTSQRRLNIKGESRIPRVIVISALPNTLSLQFSTVSPFSSNGRTSNWPNK